MSRDQEERARAANRSYYDPYPEDGPCDLCHKGPGPSDPEDTRTSEEWCRDMNACAATIELDKIAEARDQ